MPVTRMADDKVTVAAERNEILWVQFLSSRMDRVDVVDLYFLRARAALALGLFAKMLGTDGPPSTRAKDGDGIPESLEPHTWLVGGYRTSTGDSVSIHTRAPQDSGLSGE